MNYKLNNQGSDRYYSNADSFAMSFDDAWKTLELTNEKEFIFIKGLEGSIDLPSSRSCITSRVYENKFKRIILQPKKYNCHAPELDWSDLGEWRNNAILALNNKGPLATCLSWNAGVYLWLSGIACNLKEGIILSEKILSSGEANQKLTKLIYDLNRIQSKL